MVKELARRLGAVTEDADFEAKVLLESVFGRDFRLSELKGELCPSKEQLEKLECMVGQRLSGRPLQYILGEWEFFGLDFAVGEGVLIPRQDTETLVETAVEAIKDLKSPRVLDLCSGTGCVAAAIKHCCPSAEVTAVDYSPEAFAYLEKNAEKYGVKAVFGDALEEKTAESYRGLDLITANPPYLTKEDMESLQKEVQKEPETALFGGDDGLLFYRRLPKIWRRCLKSGGIMAVEIGLGQEHEVMRLFSDNGFLNVRAVNDLTRRARVVVGENGAEQGQNP